MTEPILLGVINFPMDVMTFVRLAESYSTDYPNCRLYNTADKDVAEIWSSRRDDETGTKL